MSEPFSLGDILFSLVFGCAIIFFVMIAIQRKPVEQRQIILSALFFKLILTVLSCAIAVFYYAGVADSVRYHNNGVEQARLLRSSLLNNYSSNLPDYSLWITGTSTERITILSGFTHFFLFDSFLASSFAFSLIGFYAQCLLYKTFVKLYPEPEMRKWWTRGLFFFPSLVFWSSGILKDPLGLLGLAYSMWGLHRLLQQFSFKHLVMVVFGIYILIIFRVQVAAPFALSVLPWVIGYARTNQSQSYLTNISVSTFVGRLTVILISIYIVWLVLLTNNSNYALEKIQTTIETSHVAYQQITPTSANFVITTNYSWFALLQAWPSAILLTLFRPYPWELAGVVSWLAALENLVILFLCIRACIISIKDSSALKSTLQSPFFLTCLLFVLSYSLVVGLSTPNVGSISRYRIPLIPFLVALLIILEKSRIETHSVSKRLKRMKPISFSSVDESIMKRKIRCLCHHLSYKNERF